MNLKKSNPSTNGAFFYDLWVIDIRDQGTFDLI